MIVLNSNLDKTKEQNYSWIYSVNPSLPNLPIISNTCTSRSIIYLFISQNTTTSCIYQVPLILRSDGSQSTCSLLSLLTSFWDVLKGYKHDSSCLKFSNCFFPFLTSRVVTINILLKFECQILSYIPYKRLETFLVCKYSSIIVIVYIFVLYW